MLDPQQRMHIECPHCHVGIDVVPEEPHSDLSCPSCGSQIRVVDQDHETATIETAQRKPTVGRYRVLHWVGRGKFGEVWKAFDPDLDRFVALKVPHGEHLDNETIRMFLREAQAQAQLQHPHIVPVLDAQRHNQSCYIVSDFVFGITLHDYLHENRPSFERSAQLCSQVARAIHHAHEKGIVHRDLKPGNIMLDENEQPRVLDFGLAKREAADFTIALDGAILGTPAYMSPEQARGDAIHATARSDVYSLGVILFRMLTGETPFKGGQRLLLHKILHDEPPRPSRLNPKVPRDLETICLKALEKDPAKRYASAAEFADELDRFRAGLPIHARPISQLERSWRWANRNRPLSTTLLALAVLMMIVAAAGWDRYQRDMATHLALMRRIHLDTVPPGARLVFVPVDAETRALKANQAIRPTQRSPLSDFELPHGEYLVVAEREDFGWHEVYRTVPEDGEAMSEIQAAMAWQARSDGSIALPSIQLHPSENVTAGMVEVTGGRFLMGPNAGAGNTVVPTVVQDFWIDCCEVSQAEYYQVRLNYAMLPDEAAYRGNDMPMVMVHYLAAQEYAERLGKRLPLESEYEYVATGGGKLRYPWGNDPPPSENWELRPVSEVTHDVSAVFPGVRNLYSNACEWIDATLRMPHNRSWKHMAPLAEEHNRLSRIVRGGPSYVTHGKAPPPTYQDGGPKDRYGEYRNVGLPGLGFRCVRSARPRF